MGFNKGSCKVPWRTQEAGSKLKPQPRTTFSMGKRTVLYPASLEMPHFTESKLSTGLTSVTRCVTKFFQLHEKEIEMVGAISQYQSHFHVECVVGSACGTPLWRCPASIGYTCLKFKDSVQARDLVVAKTENLSLKWSLKANQGSYCLWHHILILERDRSLESLSSMNQLAHLFQLLSNIWIFLASWLN